MDIILHEHTEHELKNYLLSAYGPLILYGRRGMGQEEAARQIAKTLLGIPSQYRSLETHPDYYEMHPEDGMIRIGQMEKLHGWCRYASISAPQKVILIFSAGLMNINAQNSLLKLLEDGSSCHIIIMVSQKPLLKTIQSRCRTIFFQEPPPEQTESFLCQAAPSLKGRPKKALGIIADGRCGLIPELLEKPDFLNFMGEYFETLAHFKERREILETLHAVREKDSRYIYDVLGADGDMELFLTSNLSLFANALYEKPGSAEAYSKHIADTYNTKELINIINAFSDGLCQMEQKKFSRAGFFRILQTMIGGK
jgi:DNA polymerase III, gamma/tau subunits